MGNFSELGLSEQTLLNLEKLGYTEPTPIQEGVIPLILKGAKNVVGQAKTGSGKTAAFGLPLIELIKTSTGKIRGLALAPTRELAIQVSKQIKLFAGKTGIKVTTIYGGQEIRKEVDELRSGVDIVVATPGRLIDHLERGRIDLKNLEFFVLDEFDEMLKMGFIDDVEQILSKCPKEKRMLFFSATMPRQIQTIIKTYMPEYEHIKIEAKHDVSTIKQYFFNVKESLKFEVLYRLILVQHDFYGLVFCKRRIDVDNLSQRLAEKSIQSEILHGEVSQNQREKTLEKFRKGHNKILIATDVAARGIDINDLGFVINYDFPDNLQDYTHRVGRTGRAGKHGVAISFLGRRDLFTFKDVNAHFGNTIEQGVVPGKKDIMNSFGERIKLNIAAAQLGEAPSAEYDDIIDTLLKQFEPKEVIKYFMTSFFGSIDTEEVHIENFGLSRSPSSGGRDGGFRPRGDYRGGDRGGDRGGSRFGSNRGGSRFGSDRGGDRGGSRFGSDRGGDRGGERRNSYGSVRPSVDRGASGGDRPYTPRTPRADGDRPYTPRPEGERRSSYGDRGGARSGDRGGDRSSSSSSRGGYGASRDRSSSSSRPSRAGSGDDYKSTRRVAPSSSSRD